MRPQKTLAPERRGRFLGAVYAWPMGLWFALFFLAPLVIIFVYSFMGKALHGGVIMEFTLRAYRQVFNPRYGIILLRTMQIALVATAASVLIALPCGYAMARSPRQNLLLILVMIPFWTNSLIRIFAWMSILSNDGVINTLLLKLGLTKDYIKLLYNLKAVTLVSFYMYLPYAILPVFTAIDRFDFSLLEAARDLGAGKLTAMIKVLIPNIRSGIITAVIFTFIPVFGTYTVPYLVGGQDSYIMIGTIIADQINKTPNWPLAAAFSVFITLFSTAGVLWMMIIERTEKAQKKSAPEGGAKEESRAL
ncbi:MAG: ABC transporter permease [Spirochaetaceae bacterium]|jgi:spermidine/putrescine transport system permease protein|nr:ABC transporter permease [Spirochaetaceae bacterium]